MTDWKDWKTNGRTFEDLIHPAGGISEEAYENSGLQESQRLKKNLPEIQSFHADPKLFKTMQ